MTKTKQLLQTQGDERKGKYMERVMLDCSLNQGKIAIKKHYWDDLAKCEQGLLCR